MSLLTRILPGKKQTKTDQDTESIDKLILKQYKGKFMDSAVAEVIYNKSITALVKEERGTGGSGTYNPLFLETYFNQILQYHTLGKEGKSISRHAVKNHIINLHDTVASLCAEKQWEGTFPSQEPHHTEQYEAFVEALTDDFYTAYLNGVREFRADPERLVRQVIEQNQKTRRTMVYVAIAATIALAAIAFGAIYYAQTMIRLETGNARKELKKDFDRAVYQEAIPKFEKACDDKAKEIDEKYNPFSAFRGNNKKD